jgi:hypothetical protein
VLLRVSEGHLIPQAQILDLVPVKLERFKSVLEMNTALALFRDDIESSPLVDAFFTAR